MSYEAWGTPPDPEPQYCPLCGETEHVEGCEIKELEAKHRDRLEKAVNAEREACAACVPTNWCDSMLTGQDAVIGKVADCRPIEAVLNAVRARIIARSNALGEKTPR